MKELFKLLFMSFVLLAIVSFYKIGISAGIGWIIAAYYFYKYHTK